MSAHPNGSGRNGVWKWTTGVLATALGTLIFAVISLGASDIPLLEQKVDAHVCSETLHETPEQKKARVREIVGPMFDLIYNDLQHIIREQDEQGRKIDELTKNQIILLKGDSE